MGIKRLPLKRSKKHWEKHAELDPMWAILTHKDQKGRWDKDQFFAIGKAEIDALMSDIAERFPALARKCALDFGCGVGRLTQALADYFDEVTGVDISEGMIQQARNLNQHGSRCSYVANDTPNLSFLASDSFDLVYSSITLQHMHTDYSSGYIREFLRVVKPSGLVVFQLPSHRIGQPAPVTSAPPGPKRRPAWHPRQILSYLYFTCGEALRELRARSIYSKQLKSDRPVIEMYGMSPDEVEALVHEGGGVIDYDRPDDKAAGWEGRMYFIRRTNG